MRTAIDLVCNFLGFTSIELNFERCLTLINEGLDNLSGLGITLIGAEGQPLDLTSGIFELKVSKDTPLRWTNCFCENYLELLGQYFTHFFVRLQFSSNLMVCNYLSS